MTTVGVAFVWALLGAGVGVIVGMHWSSGAWRDDCIKRGFAQYNATTGLWEWKQ